MAIDDENSETQICYRNDITGLSRCYRQNKKFISHETREFRTKRSIQKVRFIGEDRQNLKESASCTFMNIYHTLSLTIYD